MRICHPNTSRNMWMHPWYTVMVWSRNRKKKQYRRYNWTTATIGRWPLTRLSMMVISVIIISRWLIITVFCLMAARMPSMSSFIQDRITAEKAGCLVIHLMYVKQRKGRHSPQYSGGWIIFSEWIGPVCLLTLIPWLMQGIHTRTPNWNSRSWQTAIGKRYKI